MSVKFNDIQKILLLSFPIALISGPLIPELIIFISIIIYLFKTPIKEIKLDFSNKISVFLLILTAYIFLAGLFSFASQKSLVSSFFFFRFPLFSIIFFKNLNSDSKFKIYFLYVLISIFTFLFVDAAIQTLFKKNIFGLELIANRASSLFGDELILGSFILKLSPILLGLLLTQYRKVGKLFIFYILISGTTIVLSGERTALISYLILIFIIIFLIDFNKSKYILGGLIIIFFIIFNNQIFKERFIKDLNKKFILNQKYFYIPYEYSGFIFSSLEQFKNSPIIGGGVRSFRTNCKKTLLNFDLKNPNSNINQDRFVKHVINGKCSTHPHNLILEILSELGILGLIFVFYKYYYIIKNFKFYYRASKKHHDLSNISNMIYILSPLIITLPFLPSGSFFNNWSSSIYFLNVSFLIYAISNKNK